MSATYYVYAEFADGTRKIGSTPNFVHAKQAFIELANISVDARRRWAEQRAVAKSGVHYAEMFSANEYGEVDCVAFCTGGQTKKWTWDNDVVASEIEEGASLVSTKTVKRADHAKLVLEESAFDQALSDFFSAGITLLNCWTNSIEENSINHEKAEQLLPMSFDEWIHEFSSIFTPITIDTET